MMCLSTNIICVERMALLIGYRTPELRAENDRAMRQMGVEIVSVYCHEYRRCVMTDCMNSAKHTLLYAIYPQTL